MTGHRGSVVRPDYGLTGQAGVRPPGALTVLIGYLMGNQGIHGACLIATSFDPTASTAPSVRVGPKVRQSTCEHSLRVDLRSAIPKREEKVRRWHFYLWDIHPNGRSTEVCLRAPLRGVERLPRDLRNKNTQSPKPRTPTRTHLYRRTRAYLGEDLYHWISSAFGPVGRDGSDARKSKAERQNMRSGP